MAEKPVLYHVGRKFSSNIDRRRYFVRDMVAASVLKLVPVRTHLRTHLSTHLMVAVALTKSLPSPAHIKDREMMLGHVPSPFAARTLSLRRTVVGVLIPLSSVCPRRSLSLP